MSADEIIVLSDDEDSGSVYGTTASHFSGAGPAGGSHNMQAHANYGAAPLLEYTPSHGNPRADAASVRRLRGLDNPRISAENSAKRRRIAADSPSDGMSVDAHGHVTSAPQIPTPIDASFTGSGEALLGEGETQSSNLPGPGADSSRGAQSWEITRPNEANSRSPEDVVVISDDEDTTPSSYGAPAAPSAVAPADISSGSEMYTDAPSALASNGAGGASSTAIGFFGGNTGDRRFSHGSLPSDSDAPGSGSGPGPGPNRPDNGDSESEEEIAILSREEAERVGTFKKSTFDGSHIGHTSAGVPAGVPAAAQQQQPLYQQPQFNQPAPVYHAGAHTSTNLDANPEGDPLQSTAPQDRAIVEFFDKYSVAQLQKYEGELDAQLRRLQQSTKNVYDEVQATRQRSSMLAFDQTAEKAQLVRHAREKMDEANSYLARTKKVRRYRSVLVSVKARKQAAAASARANLHSWGGQGAVVDLDADADAGAEPMYASNVNVNPYMARGVNEDHVHLENLFRDLYKEEKVEGMAPTPETLAIQLLDHQRRGLFWLLEKERAGLGCILADDMGLGKTVQTIAVMMANAPLDPACKTTLIVGPVSLLRQWDAEIRAKVKPEHALSIAFFHGSERRKLGTFRQMAEYDVILTSYTTLASEFKNHFSVELEQAMVSRQQNVLPQRGGGGQSYMSPFYSPDARFFRIVLDEAQYIRNKLSQASKAAACLRSTLRMCLTGTPMQNNIDELYPILRFLQARPYDNERNFKQDISVALKSSNDNFDEYDRESSMKKLRAVLSAVMLRRTKDSKVDGKPLVQLPQKTVESVYVTIENEEKEYYQNLELGIQKKARKLMNSAKKPGNSFLTLLLRLRQACIHQLLVEVGELNAQENSDSFHGVNWRKMHARILQMDTRACANVSALAPNTIADPFSEDADSDQDEPSEAQLTCPSCLDVAGADSIVVLANCGHMICDGCIDTLFGEGEEARCVSCGASSTLQDLVDYGMFTKVLHENYDLTQLERFYGMSNTKKSSNTEKVAFLIRREEGFTPSAKMDRTLDIIKDVLTKTTDEKVIVFSHFTVTFDLMGYALKSDNVEFLRYDGMMNIDDKNRTISEFYQGTPRVLLISLKAGNVGLTLTCASHVIIMDPFWNPYVEDQAMDRAHRFGQQRPVRVYRLLISGSVEDRIMDLQQRKKELIGSALDEKALRSSSHLGRRELGYLFGLNSL